MKTKLRRVIAAASALAVSASMLGGLAITAGAASYANQSVDLSEFFVYNSSGSTCSYSNGVESVTVGKGGRMRRAMLDLTGYTSKENETTTKITVSYTETVSSGGRTVIGFYDSDLAEYKESAGVDTTGGAIVYGVTGQNVAKTVYYYNNGARSYVGGNFATDTSQTVSLTFDLENSTVSGNIGSQTINSLSIQGINSIDALTVSGWAEATYKISNMTITTETTSETYYDVIFDVNGTHTTQHVKEGSYLTEIPKTDRSGYIFKGWQSGSSSALISTDTLKATPVTSAVTYTAVYEADANYIEPITRIEFENFPSDGRLVAGADADTAASNPISVRAIGELGTDLIKNPDSRVNDLKVTYELKGFRWVASKGVPSTDTEGSTTYCDSYGTLVVNDDHSADFRLRSHPFNYYGEIIASVTYNGVTKTVSHPLAYIGNAAQQSANDILPRGGYIADYNNYSPDMKGYKAATSEKNTSAYDIVTDNWAAYGGNSGRGVYIESDTTGRFLKLKSTGTNSSSFAANQITSVTDTQVVFDQMVRFYNAKSTILLKSVNPVTWTDGKATTFSVNFTGSALNINGNDIASATTNTWYRVIVNSDVTSGKCYAIVKAENGDVLGQSEVVGFSDAGSVTPTYYCFRTPDNSTGELDFNNVHIYRAVIDQASMSLDATTQTLPIPEEGEAPATAELTISAKTTEGYDAIGAAAWSVSDGAEGITVTPSATDPQKATVSVDSAAAAGTATINATISGATKSIELTITSSKDSIKFDTPIVSSITIPMDDTVSQASYTANVIDKDGNNIAGKTVDFALYDSSNAKPVSLEGITLENGVLTVTKNASPAVVTVRATSTNSANETITNAVKVTIHGLAFDFGAGAAEDVAAGYTPVTPSTAYTQKLGYGITGTAAAGGTASPNNADSDYLSGTFTFKANVTPNKLYKVTLNYQGNAIFENISEDLSGVVRTNTNMASAVYQTFVRDGVLDITFTDKVASIVIEKVDDKTPRAKPSIYSIGDSTAANNGSWAYVFAKNITNYPELSKLADFNSSGRGGKNLMTYYTGGELWDRVVTNIRPGDYVMIGNMGTNGMGKTFKDDFNYYIDACLAMGAKVILNSYSPHGAVGVYTKCYNASTHTFTAYRTDSGDPTVREIYEERKDELAGFVEIGKNADAAFNAYVNDYAKNGYASADEAAQAIIKCFPDHNHYSGIATQLMLNGYGNVKGIVAQLADWNIASQNIGAETKDNTKSTGFMFTVENGILYSGRSFNECLGTVTSNGVTKSFEASLPEVTLGQDANCIIGLFVEGLEDGNAAASLELK